MTKELQRYFKVWKQCKQRLIQRLCLKFLKKFSLKTLTTHRDIPRVCLQRLPPMTPPWPPLVLEALPLLLHQDRWDLNTIFNSHHQPLKIAAIPPCSLVLCWLWKSQHQMYPGLPGKEGAPPPPASYPPPQVYLFTPWHQLVLLPCINANDLSAMMNLPSSSLRVRSRLWLRCVAPEKECCKLDIVWQY